MPLPPKRRGPRPPQRDSAPKETGVYRHPDAVLASPPAPKRDEPAARGSERAPARRDDRAPPRRDDRGPPRRDEPRAPGASPWGGLRSEPSAPRERAFRSTPPPAATEEAAPPHPRQEQRKREVRIYGRAACLAVAEDRFEAIRKLHCNLQRSKEMAPLLSRLAQARIGYNVVDDADLERLADSQHHEGIVLDIERMPQPSLQRLLDQLGRQSGPACLVALDGVGNPHNFGAILRSAVHFGARAVLVPSGSSLTLAGAVYRVAEGAAERVPVVRYDDLAQLKGHGFSLIATSGQGERRLYRDDLPARSVLLFGAEGHGLARPAMDLADARFQIPGSGRVESLNVAQAVAVVLGEWWRAARA
jgi:TrmH RNA methyltransferase